MIGVPGLKRTLIQYEAGIDAVSVLPLAAKVIGPRST